MYTAPAPSRSGGPLLVTLYSHSRISSFENCRLQFKYRYIDRMKVDVEGIEAFMGKLVHEVLEDLYGDLVHARDADPSEFGGRFDRLWEERYGPKVRIVRENMTPEDYRATGRRCVESYFTRHHPFSSGEVVGLETRVEFAIDRQGRYRILGFVDRIDKVGDDVLEIHDYKTGSLPRSGALKSDRQLSLYEIALRQRYPKVNEVRQVWHYLAHDETFVERRSLEDLRRVGQDTIAAIQTIEATTEFPPRRSALCSWCEYQEICPEWASERAARAAVLELPQAAPDPAGLPAAAHPLELPAANATPPVSPALPSAAADPRTGQYRLFE
jgi:putative RecB family exonuclease